MKKKTNILLLTDTFIAGVGGSERHIRNIIQYLPEEKYNFFIVQLFPHIDPELENMHSDLFSKSNLSLFYFPVGRIYSPNFLRIIFKVLRIVNDAKIDIVLSFHEKADILAALIPKRLKRISSRRDMLINPSQFLLYLRKVLVKRFDLICAPCRAILDHVAQMEPIDRIPQEVIFNGLDLDRFSPSIEPAKDVLALKADSIAGIMVANFHPVKGHRFFLQAAKKVKETFPTFKVFLVGIDKGEWKHINSTISQLDLKENIINLGHRSDIPKVLRACDFIISASHSEGLSNSLIEGIACGLPGIATDVGGNGEIIYNEFNGYLVGSGNTTQMSDAILRLLNNPENIKIFGQHSRKLAEKKFSLHKNINKYDYLFQKLL